MATEKRLIDANALIESGYDVTLDEVFPDWHELPESVQEAVCKHGRYLKKLIQQQPTIDAVEVVRCKDCVHYRHGTSCVCDLHSEEPDQYGSGFDMQMLPNDFCPYGERKDND